MFQYHGSVHQVRRWYAVGPVKWTLSDGLPVDLYKHTHTTNIKKSVRWRAIVDPYARKEAKRIKSSPKDDTVLLFS